MRKIFTEALFILTLTLSLSACGKMLPEKGDYWLELRNMFGEWEKTVLITGYSDDYQACMEFLEAINEWNAKNANITREYRCTPA